MKLDTVEVLPGNVISIDDPKKIGRVKATVPTLFNQNVMSPDSVPWIYPRIMHGYQTYSRLQVGSKIWVWFVKNKSGIFEYWYEPMVEYNEDTKAIIESDDANTDILLSRDAGNMKAYVYYTDSEGLMLKTIKGQGDKAITSTVTLGPDGTIKLQSGSGVVHIHDNHVYTGDGTDGQPAVMGDVLQKVLDGLVSSLNNLSTAAANPYDSALASPFTQAATDLQNNMKDLLAKNTNVN